MAFSIKKLTLYKNLRYSRTEPFAGEKLIIFTNGITKKNMNPSLDAYLTEPKECGNAVSITSPESECETLIPADTYLFVQGIEEKEDVRQAAETLWLESLWQEIELDRHTVFMRILTEDGKNIFQLFRKIL